MNDGMVAALVRLCSRNPGPIIAISSNALDYIANSNHSIPTYTDHGFNHVRCLADTLKRMLRTYTCSYRFTPEDRLILGASAILHDLGNIINRDGHSDLAVQLMERTDFSWINSYFAGESLRYLKQVVRYHSSDHDLRELCQSTPLECRLVLLCSLFKLADECDVSVERINKNILTIYEDYNLLDADGIRWWKAHLEIEKVKVDGTTVTVTVSERNASNRYVRKLQQTIRGVNLVLRRCDYPEFSLDIKYTG